MDAEVDNRKCCQNDVNEGHILEALPSAIKIVLPKGEPNRKWYCNVKGRHAICKCVNSSEPCFNLGIECVCNSIHIINVESSYSYIEEQVEWNG